MQPSRRRGLSLLILMAGLAWIAASADHTGASTAGGIPAPQKGFLAPDFTLADPHGRTYTLSGLRRQALIVNVWATWCPPCKGEMPALEAAYRKYGTQGLTVLGVNATDQDAPLDIVPFVHRYGLTFPVLLDETGEVRRRYQVRSLPSTFFIDSDGT